MSESEAAVERIRQYKAENGDESEDEEEVNEWEKKRRSAAFARFVVWGWFCLGSYNNILYMSILYYFFIA